VNIPFLPKSRGLAGWLAVGMCASVSVLAWFGYRAIREWQRSSVLLVERRANEAADLLVKALRRDMHAVHRSVLSSADWNAFMLDPPYDVSTIVASAFARYPYPESFFAARGALTPGSLMFFTRSDRPPPWAPREAGANRFPVTVQNEPGVAQAIVDRIAMDAASGRRFSIFEVETAGTAYQVIARLLYRDQLREQLDGVFGFMVNMAWARQYYFPELTSQVARIGGTPSGLALAVVDERGERVAVSTQAILAGRPTSRRAFPVMFFDPLLVAVDQPADLARREWAVQVGAAADPALTAAIRAADRTLILAACAAVSLAFGLAMTARAVRASARLTELRSEFVSTVTHELKTPIATIRAIGDTLVSGRILSSAGQREYAQLVVQEAKRLTRLVDNLLALSRMTDVTEVYSFEPLALDGLVEQTLEDFKEQLAAAGFVTRVETPADLPLVRADRTAMGLMLDNLVDNAIRYSPAERSLLISARRDDGAVALEVSDKGRGIPADEIDYVTRKFFRGRHLVSNGSGLGLAIVKRIVTDHGGRLAIQSAVNVGTTVSVILPILTDDEETDSRR
jgi:signal transduction histidine kinase